MAPKEGTAPEKAPAAPQGRFYLAHLDGLRGVGIILVVFYHLGFTFMRHAWLCISCFFALSGMLITGITVEGFEKNGKIEIPRFWARRVARLFPALFVVVAFCSVSKFFRDEDNDEFWFEKTDLLWSLTYLSNVNMVFWRKDDYFAAFQKPSITRHMWTLAIEEQYYLVWPLLFFAWTAMFPASKKPVSVKMSPLDEKERLITEDSAGQASVDQKADQTDIQPAQDPVPEGETPKPSEEDVQESQPEEQQDRLRPCLRALVVGELIVIVLSYFSSWWTIDDLGMSAAYYSTWSRVGDFACGGLVFLLIRLNPTLYRRYSRKPDLEPMSFRYRLFLEFVHMLSLAIVVFPPMVQLPLDTVLPFYFYQFRIPFSFCLMLFSAAGAFQLTEPLPKWALVTRLLSCKAMTTLGIISYFVYLIHWPLILFLGDPHAHARLEEDGGGEFDDEFADLRPGEEIHAIIAWRRALLRDWFIFVLSIFLGYVSFTAYEKPMMVLGAKHKPRVVILSGFIGAGITAGFVCLCFQGLDDPHKKIGDLDGF